MKTAKFLVILFMTLGLSQCGTVKFDKNPPFKVVSATFNNWVGGQPGISGTKVRVLYESTSNVTFDEIFFKNMKVKPELYVKNNTTYLIGHYSTSDNKELTLDLDTRKEVKNKLPEPLKLPFKMKGNEVVLKYTLDGKVKYYKIEAPKQADTDFYK